MPMRSHSASCNSTVCITHWSIWRTTPRSSAIGTNSDGVIMPRTGCCQRNSASTATMRPLRISTLGW